MSEFEVSVEIEDSTESIIETKSLDKTDMVVTHMVKGDFTKMVKSDDFNFLVTFDFE